MEWLIFTCIAIIFWLIVNIMDKYIASHELKDPVLVSTVTSFTVFTVFLVYSLFNGAIEVKPIAIITSILSAFCYPAAIWFYYRVISKEDISRVASLLATEPLFVAVVAYFAFNEHFSILKYFGIVLIVLGAIFVSHQDGMNRKLERKLHFFTLMAMFLWALRSLLFKYSVSVADFHASLFWFAFGGLIVPLILFSFHHPRIREKARKGVFHLIVTSFFAAAAMLAFFKAISIGPISIISALVATKPLLVFVVATVLSIWYPKIIREKLTTKALLKKGAAAVLVVIGGILIIF